MKTFITIPFTEPYLEKLADLLEEDYLRQGKDLSRVALIFGGKRPRLFLNRILARRQKKSLIPPRVFTINEFVSCCLRQREEFSALPEMEDSFLIYQLAQKHTPEICRKRDTFAAFLPWAREILKFIDQLDLEDVPASALENIQANAAIGYPVPEDINRLLQHLVKLRGVYHEAITERRQYSRGFQYLRAAALIGETQLSDFDEVIVCNFFYFHRCEEVIMKSLLERGQARFVFQGDERKWPVLARIAKRFGCELREGKEPPAPEFALKLYEGFDGHSQAAAVREILEEIPDHERAVIVLPRPAHLLPLVTEISAAAKEFNVSMGYPLKRSSLYALLTAVFRAQRTRRGGTYYARDYLKVLQHPFVKNLKLGINPAVCRILVHRIEEILTGQHHTPISGRLFLDLADVTACDDVYMLVQETLDRLRIDVDRPALQAILEELHELLFHGWETVETFAAMAAGLERLLDALTEKSFMHQYPLNLNIAARMYDLAAEFRGAAFGAEVFAQDDLFRIIEEKIGREIVAFHGSPLKGLQVLGLFETRSLNFDHVIVMDTNEGVLPTLNLYEPLIPREVMISLNLDRLELEEEIQRYQFMRLISSAKNVHLVYQANRESERSRFIEELIWDAEKRTGKPGTVPFCRTGFNVRVSRKLRAAAKTPEILEHLRAFKFSATSLNAYLKNPYEFYQRYCLGLKEKDDLLDEPEARQVGTFVHELLEHSYRPFVGHPPKIDAEFRGRFTRQFEQKFDEIFGRSMGSDAFLLRAVLTERLKRFLDYEQEEVQPHVARILYLEKPFEETIELSSGPARFKYIVDRVDLMKNGTVMIMDYKTGNVDNLPRAVSRIAGMTLSRETVRDQVKSFQIPLYFHYLTGNFPGQPVNAALYSLKTITMNRFIDAKTTHTPEAINTAFLRALDFIIAEILDPAVDFVEDENAGEDS